MARKGERRLVVLDGSPTGAPVLDGALTVLSARGRPWAAFSCIPKIWKPVASATQDALIHRGAITRDGPFGGNRTTLSIADEHQHREAVFRLDTAWLKPDSVTDPRSGAFVDLLRNAGERFNRGAQHETVISREWYPAEVRDTVATILEAERLTTSASSGTGYEG